MIITKQFFKKFFISLISFLPLIFSNISKAENVQIILKDGTGITGKIIEKRSDMDILVINNKFLGLIKIPINSLLENDTNKGIVKQLEINNELSKSESNENLSVPISINWLNTFQGGFTNTSSSTRESIGYSLSTNSKYEGIFNNYNIFTSYSYDQNSLGSSKVIGVKRGNIDLLKERKLTRKLSFYNTLHFSFDEALPAGKERILKSLGLGYYFLKNDKFSFQTMVGPAAIYTSKGELCSAVEYCGDLVQGYDIENILKWVISKNIDLSIYDIYSLANMGGLKGANYLRIKLNFHPYETKNLFLSLFYENSHYEFTPKEPTNAIRFEIGKRF